MIFVTGGTGLLGSHFLYELTKDGKRVRALKRRNSDTSLVAKVFSYYTDQPVELLSLIDWVDGDLLDFGSIEDALEGVTEVYHAGAMVSFYPKDHKSMLNVNVNGTTNLVNICLDKNIDKFCYVSSVATLGRAEVAGTFSDEDTHWQQNGRNSIYSISKFGAEREVWRAMEEGLNAVIINPSVILGPGFWEDNSGLFPLVWKGLKYYTKGINGYVDVRDVAKAMKLVVEKELFNQRFVVSAVNLSYQELFTLIARHLQKPSPSVHISPKIAAVAWRVEAARSFITGSLPKITREMANTTSQQYFYSNEKIKKSVHFQFRGVEESIKDICSIFLKEL